MAAVILTTLRSLNGDHASAAATAFACGWRIDEDRWWVRILGGAEPKESPHSGHIRDGYVFIACAGAALAFDIGDLTFECEAHT